MRVFVTGATGFIGSVITQELIQAGHQVIGLARSDASAKALLSMGAEVHKGGLEDVDSLRSGAAAADGVIHAAFIHDFSKYEASCAIDKRAIAALGSVLIGSDRPLVVTSGTLLLTPGHIAVEEDRPASGPSALPRIASEEAAQSVAAQGVSVMVLRLPPSVHGQGDHAFVPALIELAKKKGASAYIGDGANRWPAVHRLDAAKLYRLVFEKGAAGANYHGVADDGVAFKTIAEVIGRKLNIPVVSKSREEAPNHFDWLAHFVGIDNPISSKRTQEELGWRPTQPGLIADINSPSYF